MSREHLQSPASPVGRAALYRPLGITMAFVAGAMNAGGFLVVGRYTSHMTGIVSSISGSLASYEWKAVIVAASFLLSFMAGAMTSCIIINLSRARQLRNEFAPAILAESLLLIVFGISWTFAMGPAGQSVHLTIALLCFIMGLQNAIITKFSRAEIRTTHVTGLVTDIGIEIGRYFSSHFIVTASNVFHLKRLALHSILLAAFLIGGVLGILSFENFGFITTVPLAVVLATIAALPYLIARGTEAH